ncbi:M15 family metallopeptidase [Microbulbifer variabilis]|uniref:M15 family metallopeptidase n=1 Tax=Microbulbifer variabilis TaxID=266805 RepID=UPI00037B3612|nr:M15 family metallopeptidase [Microbulbifer variabilis]
MYKLAITILFGLALWACTKSPLSDIDIYDFRPESEIGVYDVSQKDCELMGYRQVIRSDSPIGCGRLKRVVFNFYPLLPNPTEKSNATSSNKGATSINQTSTIKTPEKGAIIVLDVVAAEVLDLFTELYQLHFPIESAIPIEYFTKKERLADDMNNTLAFDSRPITGGNKWSEHAYGVAIDINPLQNPYLHIDKHSKAVVIPKDATEGYLNRAKYRAGKPIRKGMSEDITTVFAKHGFAVWGGDWNAPIDYMHFQVGTRQFINRLVSLPVKEAKLLFNQYVSLLNQCFKENTLINNPTHLRKYCVDRVTPAFGSQ